MCKHKPTVQQLERIATAVAEDLKVNIPHISYPIYYKSSKDGLKISSLILKYYLITKNTSKKVARLASF